MDTQSNSSVAPAFAGKRVLITGGLGFIGSNLARTLACAGARVTLVDSMIPNTGASLFNVAGIESQVQINISDVRDAHSLQYLVQGQDFLFNLAGQTSHMDSMEDPLTDLAVNASAQLSLLEVVRRHNPTLSVVFASTRQIYGRPQYLPVDERHPLEPVDVNGINKLAGEWYHLLYARVYDLHTCVLRLTNTYGPRMRIKDARQTFVGVWIRNILEGKPIEVWGGTQLRDFTYVDDAVSALLLGALRPAAQGRVFNLGGEAAISLVDLARLLIELHGGGELVIREFPEARKKIDIGDYYADIRLARTVLGWEPAVPVREGLKRTLDFFGSHISQYV